MYRKFLFISSLLALFLTSCELHESQESLPVPQARQGGCSSQVRWFDLEQMYLSPGTFNVWLETGPFVVKECMCRVIEYQLFVTACSAAQWSLLLHPDLVVPYVWSVVGTQDRLRITDLGPIFEAIGNQATGALKVSATSNTPIENAELQNSGGLCVVENFDGNGTVGYPIGTAITNAIVILDPGPDPGSMTVKVYIPEGITVPM